MGSTENRQRDTEGFGQGHISDLIVNGFAYDGLSSATKHDSQEKLRRIVARSLDACPEPERYIAYGWKRPITVFLTPIILETFPDARVVHLIRDGRDVMLSRLNSRMSQLQSDVNRLTVFGDSSKQTYRNLPLNAETVEAFRNEIEMHHWVTAVRAGMRGRMYADRYVEVKYELLCTHPVAELARIFEILGIDLLPETAEWIRAAASTRAIGKWRGREEELAPAIAIGEPLLRELGYIDEKLLTN